MDAAALQNIITEKDRKALDELGGVEGVAKALGTDLKAGLSSTKISALESSYGRNVFEYPAPDGLLKLIINAFGDLTVRILTVASLVSLGIGAGMEDHREEYGYLEGIAILLVVMVVVCLQAGIDYTKEKKFRQLNSVKDSYAVKVLRDGHAVSVKADDICVGDVVCLTSGDKAPADGLYIDGSKLKMNESAMTGEPIDIGKDSKSDPFVLSGTTCSCGSGNFLVIAVGSRSMWGAIIKELVTEPEDTPLQERLDNLVLFIGNWGLLFAGLTFLASMIHWIVHGATTGEWDGQEVVTYIINSITIVVVAIPEGLPLAITLGLAFAMRKMMEDMNLVRRLEACETMGSATQLNADKTGTLTQNRMTVMEAWIPGLGQVAMPPSTPLGGRFAEQLSLSICVNSDADLKTLENGRVEHLGSKTECALIQLSNDLGFEYKAVREKNSPVLARHHFTSARKMMSTVLSVPGSPGNQRIFVKGASEIVLERCVKAMDSVGNVGALDSFQIAEAHKAIVAMATTGLRTLCIAYSDIQVDESSESAWDEPGQTEHNLTLLAIVGIKDPIRPETAEAVKLLRGAGVSVRMVTGDNVLTASSIAKEAGILDEGGLVMEGPVFRHLPLEEQKKICLQIQVLARSSPTDKQVLCAVQRSLGEVVAVTGDGTNDAPALKEADVGFALGIAGTEIAKEACDIIILDDNIKSMAKAVLWGRNVFHSIRKFLQFQLVVNVVACTLNLVSACAGVTLLPLGAIPLLWVNMIMDSMGALALATEPPDPKLMQNAPFGRSAPLLNKVMYRNIIGIALYQLAVCFVLLFHGHILFNIPCKDKHDRQIFKNGMVEPKVHFNQTYYGNPENYEIPSMDVNICPGTTLEVNSIIFNAFVWMQIFSEVNSRKFGDIHIFENIFKSWYFCGIMIATMAVQVGFIQGVGSTVVGPPIGFVHLNGPQWAASIIIGIVCLPIGFLTRFIPLKWIPGKTDEQAHEEEMIRIKKETEQAAPKGPDNANPKVAFADDDAVSEINAPKRLSANWQKAKGIYTTLSIVNTITVAVMNSKSKSRPFHVPQSRRQTVLGGAEFDEVDVNIVEEFKENKNDVKVDIPE